jgi:hypothetical protein
VCKNKVKRVWFLILKLWGKIMIILQNVTSNSTSQAQENYSYLQTVYCFGTFGGANVNLQGSPDGVEWFDLINFTNKEVVGIGLSVRFFRAVVTGATATTNLTLLLQ